MKQSEKTWMSYPRPQMRRENYAILNGIWKCNGVDILVPVPPQSKASGFAGEVTDVLEYETTFQIPQNFTKERILLHFGAVDQIAEVWVNDVFLGKHEGGYLPFSFDMTEAVVGLNCNNHLRVKVTDSLDKKYPYGKQTKKRGGMWYTPVSGIWQTVWMENVPEEYIESIKITPDMHGIDIALNLFDGETKIDAKGFEVNIFMPDGTVVAKKFEGNISRIDIENPILWNTDNPYLYNLTVSTKNDKVESYFALREVKIKKIDGISRVCLNDKPIFMHGVLDQGYFEDGIYLPKEESEYEKDVLRMKELGYNMLRKHIKIEPEAFYYACDCHGMLVMQDMVNNGSYSWFFDTALPNIGLKKRKDTKLSLDSEVAQIFIRHMKETQEHLYNHPSIIAYTIFNEGWGQFHSDAMYDLAKVQDATRLYDSTSGWFAQKKNDFDSEHIYFKVIDLNVKERPLFVTECGGYALPVEGHCFNPEKEYGYGKCKDSRGFTDMILAMYEKMILPGIEKGVCGCIYTQLSDVEDEINGFYTYDRKVCKVVKEDMVHLAKKLYAQIEKVNH